MSGSDEAAVRAAGAAVFADPDVVASYHGRQPYAPALYQTLLAVVPGRDRVLDIGCGPGKVARVLADCFDQVVALDPSAPMLATGKAADAGRHPNIHWVLERAETYETAASFDLIVAGASIHWTDPAAVFPKLVRWTPVVALLNDAPTFPDPAPPCGRDAWVAFLDEWLQRTGRQLPAGWRTPLPDAFAPLGPHGDWLDVAGRCRFTFRFRQSVSDFIAGNHGRMNWQRRRIGEAVAAAFDAALDALLRPFADAGGILDVAASSELVWGAPRATPAAMQKA
jgi:SAM-dependent methyltransferase